MDRCKNFFALGMCYWLYNRPMDATYTWLDDKFKSKPVLAEANKLAMKAGYAYCEATEAFQVTLRGPAGQARARASTATSAATRRSPSASWPPRSKSGLPLFQGCYPITPASDILHELSMYKEFGVMTFQAEDEIAAVTSAIGAAYGGRARLTTTSGPGMALKMEAIGLAIATELPLVICDIQRGGPSTGPAHQDRAGRPAAGALRPQLRGAGAGARRRHARRLLLGRARGQPHRAQVHGAGDRALRRLPRQRRRAVEDPRRSTSCPTFPVKFRTDPEGFHALPARPGHAGPARGPSRARPGLEHRIGGLEKQDVTGNVNYEPLNHERMVRLRAAKVAARRRRTSPTSVPAGDPDGDLLLVGWGSTYGAITAALRAQRDQGPPHRPRPPAPPEPAARRTWARC